VPPGGYVDVSRLKVEPIGFTEARRFVVEHHYAGTYPSDVWRVGAFQQGRDGHFRLVGVCVFSTHVNPATSARWVKAAIDPDELMPERPPVPDLAGLTPAQQSRALAKAEQQRQRETERIRQRRELAAQQAASSPWVRKQARVEPDIAARVEDHIAAREERVARLLSGPVKSLDLGRFVLLPDLEGNAETYFLRRALWSLAQNKPDYDVVISMSDPMSYRTLDGRLISPGHYGGIYVAGGLRHVGRSRAEWRKLAPDGQVIQGRAVAKARGGEQGKDYAIRRLVAWGAPEPEPDEDIGEWVSRALRDGPFRRIKHPGNLVYAAPVSPRYARLVNARLLPALPPPTSAARVPCPVFLDSPASAPTLPLTWALP
jgi:hypothetical protein